MAFEVVPIGAVRRDGGECSIVLEPEYGEALALLDRFSHIVVIWWAHKHDNDESRAHRRTEPPYAPGRVHGIFATRAEYRPNPVAMTVCELLDVDSATIRIRNIDAVDGTPVVDIKPYYPVCDRVKDARIPEWLSDWPEWFPEEGFGLD